jgi:hypothetical protein
MDTLNLLDVLVFAVLSLAGIVGLLAIFRPQTFVRTAAACSRWVDSERLLRIFDKRFDVDRWFLPHCRLLGLLVVLSISLLAYCWIAV